MQVWQNERMECPNCQAELKPEKIGSTVYWRCASCGALWFDNKESDFLSEEEAAKLNKIKKQPSFSRLNYTCPRDKTKLKYDGYYYRCYSCGGLMASSASILEEKMAKRQRLASTLKKPISFSQMKNVVIFALAVLFVGVNVSLVNGLRHRLTLETQAQQVKSTLQIHAVNQDKLALYFNTEEPYRTTALFKSADRQWEQVINPNYSLNHFLIVSRPSKATKVQVRLQSVKNEEYLTEEVALEPR